MDQRTCRKFRIQNIKHKTSYKEIVGSTRKDTNLFDYEETFNCINEVKPDIVINAAAKVGGILANNTLRSEFIIENLKNKFKYIGVFKVAAKY